MTTHGWAAELATWPADVQADFNERAGIKEFCGNLRRGEAERQAFLEVKAQRTPKEGSHVPAHQERPAAEAAQPHPGKAPAKEASAAPRRDPEWWNQDPG